MGELRNAEGVRTFVAHIRKHGYVTKRSQPFYHGLGYYMTVWDLRDAGVIAEDGTNEGNEKMWKLTEKGVKLAAMMDKFDKMDTAIKELIKS